MNICPHFAQPLHIAFVSILQCSPQRPTSIKIGQSSPSLANKKIFSILLTHVFVFPFLQTLYAVPPPTRAYLRTLIHNADLEHLEKVVLDGHGQVLLLLFLLNLSHLHISNLYPSITFSSLSSFLFLPLPASAS